jgi:broad specificity phosphatase PhoE
MPRTCPWKNPVSNKPPIIFIRHGETDWNKRGLIQGSVETDLNETGHEQARIVARALAANRVLFAGYDLICSPQRRARQTMAHIVVALERENYHVQIDDRVRELGFGVWESKPFWELKGSAIYPADPEDRYYWKPEGGESYADGVLRTEAWQLSLLRPTIVVSHGAVGRCLLGRTLGMSRGEIVEMKTPQGAYCIIREAGIQWFDPNGFEA